MLLDLSKGFWFTLTDYLSSYGDECVIAALIVAVIVGLVFRAAVKQDMEEKPWKYREWIDADGAKKKAKQEKKQH